MALRKHIINGVKWGIISKILLFIISILQLVLVVNIIGPQSYGTMAILGVFEVLDADADAGVDADADAGINYLAPFPFTTTRAVLKRILTSSQNDQFCA